MKPLLIALGAGLLLAGCATVPADANTATQQPKETASMTAHNTPLQLSPEELLNRILDLMAASESVQDFTPQRVGEMIGIEFIFDKESNTYKSVGQITESWGYSFMKYKVGGSDSFSFSFDPLEVHGEPEVAKVCGMNFDAFVRKAEALGFMQLPLIDIGAQQAGVTLKRGELYVYLLVWEKYPRGVMRPDPKACIKMIVVD